MSEAIRVLIERTFNGILKERDIAEYEYKHAGESAYYKSGYDECEEALKDLRELAAAKEYKFEEGDWEKARIHRDDSVVLLRYPTYKLVPLAQ